MKRKEKVRRGKRKNGERRKDMIMIYVEVIPEKERKWDREESKVTSAGGPNAVPRLPFPPSQHLLFKIHLGR